MSESISIGVIKMKRFAHVLALALVANLAFSGCSSAPQPPTPQPAESEGRTSQTPSSQPANSPAPPPWLGVKAVGDDLELTGLTGVSAITWSPSGRRALVASDPGWFLLDTEGPSIEPIPPLENLAVPPAFWSENEVLWMKGGRLQLRNLATGEDRLLHDFGAQAIHWLRPGDTHYVVIREPTINQQEYRFGAIVSGELGGSGETVVIKTGHVIGRMASGDLLAVEGQRGGPLWAISPTGEKRLLSQQDAYFVRLSPDGTRALWFTGEPREASWLGLFKPATAYADAPFDPPLTDLWTWDGAADPVRIPLGGTYSVQALFSPDGTHIVLALNEGILSENSAALDKPGHLAVVTGARIRTLATFEGRVGLGMWLGTEAFKYTPPMEKTGAQPPIFRIDLTGKTEALPGLWQMAYSAGDTGLLLLRDETEAVLYWSDSAQPARTRLALRENPGQPLYVPPGAPYLPFVRSDRVLLKRLSY